LRNVSIFSLDPENEDRLDDLVPNPVVLENGSGVVAVAEQTRTLF